MQQQQQQQQQRNDELQREFETLIAEAEKQATRLRGAGLADAMHALAQWIEGIGARGVDALTLREFRRRLERLRGLCGLLSGALHDVLVAAAAEMAQRATVPVYGRDARRRAPASQTPLTKRVG